MKDWTGNKTSIISTSGFHNNSKHEREKRDFYATDPIALEKLLQKETFSNVWECADGMGHLCNVLKKYNILSKHSDIVYRGCGEVIDFLKYNGKWDGDIITNPPYKYSVEFVYKALEIIEEGNRIAMLFPQRYLSSQKRYKLFITYPPQYVYAFGKRVSCYLNGNKKEGENPAVDYLWIIWEKGFKGETILRWIL